MCHVVNDFTKMSKNKSIFQICLFTISPFIHKKYDALGHMVLPIMNVSAAKVCGNMDYKHFDRYLFYIKIDDCYS